MSKLESDTNETTPASDDIVAEQNETPTLEPKTENPVKPEAPVTPPISDAEVTSEPVKPKNPLQRFGSWVKHHKKLSIPLAILIILAALYAVPQSRYGIASLFINRQVNVVLTDQQSGKPLSSALVSVDGKQATTDQSGKATVSGVTAGFHKVTITKNYYTSVDQSIEIPVYSDVSLNSSIKATGRQVPVAVINAITGAALEGSKISFEKGSESLTNAKGEAIVVIPSDNNDVKITVTSKDYNQASATLKATGDAKANTVKLVPAGKIMFLSKASGKVDVVSSNLDGSERKTVLAGTGLEEDGFGSQATSLLASRDWKYATLFAKRQQDQEAGLYLINAADGTVVPIEEGNIPLTPIGWLNGNFIYIKSDTNGVAPSWQAKRFALKSYDAAAKKTITLDESDAVGDKLSNGAYQSIANAYIVESQVVYSKVWQQSQYRGYSTENIGNLTSTITTISANGQNKKDVKTMPAPDISYLSAQPENAQEIYYQLQGWDNSSTYFTYTAGTMKNIDATEGAQTFNKPYATYLVSPNGQNSFWSDERDGKFALLVGDKAGENSKTIATASEYKAYGWYTDKYLLVTKDNSELFVIPASGIPEGSQAFKISDYHKPRSTYNGYGYGYGGQ